MQGMLCPNGCCAVLGGVPARRYRVVVTNKIAEKPGEKADKLGSKLTRSASAGWYTGMGCAFAQRSCFMYKRGLCMQGL